MISRFFESSSGIDLEETLSFHPSNLHNDKYYEKKKQRTSSGTVTNDFR